jgi:hypothetical protein
MQQATFADLAAQQGLRTRAAALHKECSNVLPLLLLVLLLLLPHLVG